jgi:hypothetical protein
MKRFPLFLLLILLASLFEACSVNKMPTAHEQLLEASKAANREIVAEETFTISRGREALVIAPLKAWADIPATKLPSGIDIAFAYVNIASLGAPAGYYTLRMYSDDVRIGNIKAKLQFIDREGKVAAELLTDAEIHQLTVPAGPRSIFVTTMTPSGGQSGNESMIWIRCSNGTCGHIPTNWTNPFNF